MLPGESETASVQRDARLAGWWLESLMHTVKSDLEQSPCRTNTFDDNAELSTLGGRGQKFIRTPSTTFFGDQKHVSSVNVNGEVLDGFDEKDGISARNAGLETDRHPCADN